MAYIGNQPTIGQYRKLDDISGSFNGSLTAFTMQVGSTNVSAGSVFQLLISLGGVIQNPGTDFTVSGSTLTFTTAPTSGLDFFGILMGQPLNTATPGDSTVTGAKIVDGTITGAKLAAAFNYDSGLLFLDDTNNRVGIGTTSPQTVLQANGVISSTAGTGNLSVEGAYMYYASNEANFLSSGSSANRPIVFSQYNGSTSTERLRIDSSGRFLVGTANSPSAGDGVYSIQVIQGYAGVPAGQGLMSLQRGETASNITSNETIGVISFNDSDGYVFGQIYCQADNNAGASDFPGRLVFSTTADGASSPTERMRISANGFINAANDGGYFSAGYNAHTFTTSQNNWSTIVHNNNASASYGALFEFDTDHNNTGSYFWQGRGAANNRATLYANGGLANYQANNVNLCDEREKKNIEALDSTWGCLKNWDLKKFHYNEDADTDDKRYGVIAQQVAPHCPEVISDWVKQKAEDAVLDEDGNVVTPAKEEITRMAVKEQQMMWMAIKALQEAQIRIETLETANASLEARLTALEGA